MLSWRCRGSNPGPFTCKANALPLSYNPTMNKPIISCKLAKELKVNKIDICCTREESKAQASVIKSLTFYEIQQTTFSKGILSLDDIDFALRELCTL